MTSTSERAELLANHCDRLSSERFLGAFSSQDLLDWVELELSHAMALDGFVEHGKHPNKMTKAVANEPILHILSGNTPHAGLQSLLRGLLVGAMNYVKLPSSGLSELSAWVKDLPAPLAKLVTVVDKLDEEIFHAARTVIAIGADSTMEAIQRRISPRQRYIPHGHKLSIGLVHTPSVKAAELVAQDACAFNQQGCLSLHTVYVRNNARDFLPLLADAMLAYEKAHPRGEISISESGAISNLREVVRYEAANDSENVELLNSEGNTNWTAIYRNSPTLTPSVLNRVVSVQPWPTDINELGPEREFISTLAVESPIPDSVKNIDIPRICPLGESQKPSLSWHHDGFEPLGSLVRWRDLES